MFTVWVIVLVPNEVVEPEPEPEPEPEGEVEPSCSCTSAEDTVTLLEVGGVILNPFAVITSAILLARYGPSTVEIDVAERVLSG
jgi:hypothetical protein